MYFLGLPFQHTPTSEHVGGVGNDARHISEHIASSRFWRDYHRARRALAFTKRSEVGGG